MFVLRGVAASGEDLAAPVLEERQERLLAKQD